MHIKMNLCLMLLAVLLLSACGDTANSAKLETPEPVQEQAAEKEVPPPQTYDAVTACFSDIADGSEIIASERNGRIEVTLTNTDMDPEIEPESWSDTTSAFATALVDAKPLAGDYGCSEVFAQLKTADGTILVSGFDGKVKFDLFAKSSTQEGSKENPPTISKFEYDQIIVGMRYSEVCDIIGSDGTLETEIGDTGGVFGSTRNYTWQGEGTFPGSASITFDDFEVYSKFEIGLE